MSADHASDWPPARQGLGAAVSAWCASMGVPHLSLVLFDRDRVQTCFYGAAAGEDVATPVTCLAKPLTMLLVQKAAEEGRLDLASPVGVTLSGARTGSLGVRLLDLLSHTHGIDGDDIARAPRLANGRIDAQSLLAGVEGRVMLHQPGEAHSYSDFGYWLLGAVLEQTYDRAFGLLLAEFLADILGADAHVRLSAGAPDYCPAQGCGLALTARDLASIMRFYVSKRRGSARDTTILDPQRLIHSVCPFPGWTAADDGFALGWRYHGGGWFGHSGRENLEQIAIVRFNPAVRAGMAIISTDGRAFLLGEHIASLLTPRQRAAPRQPAPTPADPPAHAEHYCGAFANGAVRLHVRLHDDGRFLLVRVASGIEEQWSLRWAQNNTAFVTQPGLGAPYFIQYLGFEPGAGYQHLWTGSRLWRRAPGA